MLTNDIRMKEIYEGYRVYTTVLGGSYNTPSLVYTVMIHSCSRQQEVMFGILK